MKQYNSPWSVARWQTQYEKADVLDNKGVLVARVEVSPTDWSPATLISQAPVLLKAVKLALLEFDRISYQKKADPAIINLLERAVKIATGGGDE